GPNGTGPTNQQTTKTVRCSPRSARRSRANPHTSRTRRCGPTRDSPGSESPCLSSVPQSASSRYSVRHNFLTPRVGPGGFPYGARRDRVPAHSSRSVIEREERTGKGPRPEVGRDYFVTFRLYGSRRAPESNVSLTDCWSFL